MLKIFKKIRFSSDENKMNSIANTKIARDLYYSAKNQNVKFLLEKRFSWMNNFIGDDDKGIEVGSGAGFTKDFIKNKCTPKSEWTDDHIIPLNKYNQCDCTNDDTCIIKPNKHNLFTGFNTPKKKSIYHAMIQQ